MVSGATRTDPPGLPLGTGSLEATKVGTGGHGSGRRTPCDVLLENVAHPRGIPFGPAACSNCPESEDELPERVSPDQTGGPIKGDPRHAAALDAAPTPASDRCRSARRCPALGRPGRGDAQPDGNDVDRR